MTAQPQVRPLSPIELPSENDSDQKIYLLRDPAALADDQIQINLPTLCLIELLDGSRTPEQAIQRFGELTGIELPVGQLEGILEHLDRSYLLENQRARDRLAALSPRPYQLAGSGYPGDPQALRAYLDDLVGADEPSGSAKASHFRASILPHIDFPRGRDAYRAGYRHLRSLFEAEDNKAPVTVVVLGISHAYSRVPFLLTRKDFDTPLGVVKTAQNLVDDLSRDLPFDPFLDEYNHISEHSIEFHAVILKHLAGPERPLTIVPVLCGSFFEAIRTGKSPKTLPGVSEFLARLHKLRGEHPEVHFLASVDLAHKGRNFDEPALDQEQLDRLKNEDLKTLSHVERGDAEGFFGTLQADAGVRNYCGTPAIYAVLDLFPEPFQMEHYRQCTDPDLSSTVTVCAALLR